jgi:cytochrome c-type biogenesis protein
MMDWGELLKSVSLGNAAILTNVCMLPLYPGLVAFLAGNMTSEGGGEAGASPRVTRWLGFVVLAGILTMMVAIGFLLYSLSLVTADVATVLLPIIYVMVIAFGVLILSGRSPFAKLATVQAPVVKNPYVTAYTYGLLLAPMTIPCTGAFLFAQFAIGAGSAGGLVESLAYIVAFGIGFGWPLVILPFFAVAAQRNFTGWLTRNHQLLNRIAGVLLIAIGVFGFVTEVIPNINIA